MAHGDLLKAVRRRPDSPRARSARRVARGEVYANRGEAARGRRARTPRHGARRAGGRACKVCAQPPQCMPSIFQFSVCMEPSGSASNGSMLDLGVRLQCQDLLAMAWRRGPPKPTRTAPAAAAKGNSSAGTGGSAVRRGDRVLVRLPRSTQPDMSASPMGGAEAASVLPLARTWKR